MKPRRHLHFFFPLYLALLWTLARSTLSPSREEEADEVTLQVGLPLEATARGSLGREEVYEARDNRVTDSWERYYLNGLVAATEARANSQASNIAFMKTHKTASTTLAYLLFRFARRHHLKLACFDGHNSAIPLEEAVAQTKKGKGRVDIMHYHMSAFGQYSGTWEDAKTAYRQIMRTSKKVNFITVMREPRNHLISYYYYFLQPTTKKSIQTFLTQTDTNSHGYARLNNSLSAEFGISTREQLENVLLDIPSFELVILTEQFDEGLMVLRRLLEWSMIDMTYISMYKTTKGAMRFDGMPLVNAPHFEDLPEHVQNIIDDLTGLDRMLYDTAEREYEKRRILVAKHLEDDLAEFKVLQSVVSAYLAANTSSKANDMYKTADIYKDEDISPLEVF